MRVYCGFGDDAVDPLIAADKEEFAPAFRDCAYVVFEDLELGDYGNRIPALSFEVFAEGDAEGISLDQLVPGADAFARSAPLAHARGFADEGGPLASTLAAIDQVIPLVCMSGSEGLTVATRSNVGRNPVTLPDQLALQHSASEDARYKQRAGIPTRTPAALRYYDDGRDYQTGVQRAAGGRDAGRELMIDLPATMSASGARQLANESANRARWQHETITWQIGELDPRIMPGSIVRVPDMPGNWLLRSWEWMDRGITVELERLAPSAGAARPSDPGESLSPIDLVIPSTRLAVIELPPEDGVNPDAPLIFAAASAQSNVWRGAALFALQGTALIDLGTTGTQRATMGTLHDSLPASQCLLFEPYATATIDLVAPDLELIDTDIEGIAAGANRLLIGGELVQFLRALPLGERRWQLTGLLRGRGGTETAASQGHAPQTTVVLLDDSLVPLSSVLIPPVGGSRVAALGTGDPEPVIAPLANAGLSRRPPCPVHPIIHTEIDQAHVYRWTRRARGQWRWDDSVEVPLVEEREAYVVGFGPSDAPHVAWQRDAPWLRLTLAERTAIMTTYGPGDLWVRQMGTFAQSLPLLLAPLS